MNQRRKANGADHGQHPIFRHQSERAGEPQPYAGSPCAFLKRVQIGQYDKRQGDELQQIRVVLKALEIEDRVEREHHHDKERAAAIDHAQRNEPANHYPDAERRHRQRVGRPILDRKEIEPQSRDPAGQRRMLAVTELEFLSPGKRLRDVHMDILRRF